MCQLAHRSGLLRSLPFATRNRETLFADTTWKLLLIKPKPTFAGAWPLRSRAESPYSLALRFSTVEGRVDAQSGSRTWETD
uniref:Uncharacterized protein n=1 Tax=Oryza sativa subsp. japonica TaxID=39947 RepID=Q7F811_ORYSJ|nr:unnamed protein product [Oryza sativa Japonica Group]